MSTTAHAHAHIRRLFVLSDIIAWLWLLLAVLMTLSTPVSVPVYLQATHQPVHWPKIWLLSAMWLFTALGAVLLVRRRIWGLPLALLPALALLGLGKWLASLWLLVILSALLGTPYFWVYRQARGGMMGFCGLGCCWVELASTTLSQR